RDDDEQRSGEQQLAGRIDAHHEVERGDRDQRDRCASEPGLQRAHYFAWIRLAAASSASFGGWRPSITLPSADTIADQKRPISGLFGIGAPSCAEAIVAWIFGSFLSSA